MFRRREKINSTAPAALAAYIMAYSELRDSVKYHCQNIERHLEETESSDNFTLQQTANLRLRSREIADSLARNLP